MAGKIRDDPDTQTGERRRRSDGAVARKHLLRAALQLFAEKGFAKTSTRDIARAAGSNIAAISYYFGDKGGLYRAAYLEPMGRPDQALGALEAIESHPFKEALTCIISYLVAPLRQGEMAHLSLRLRHREILEPTGLMTEELDMCRAVLRVLESVLGRRLGPDHDNQDVQRLAFSIFALSVQQLTYHDLLKQIYPGLVSAPAETTDVAAQLLTYAEALTERTADHRR